MLDGSNNQKIWEKHGARAEILKEASSIEPPTRGSFGYFQFCIFIWHFPSLQCCLISYSSGFLLLVIPPEIIKEFNAVYFIWLIVVLQKKIGENGQHLGSDDKHPINK